MGKELRDEDFRTDIGRSSGGTFIRVVHLPTGTSRLASSLDSRKSSKVASDLYTAVVVELEGSGWIRNTGFPNTTRQTSPADS